MAVLRSEGDFTDPHLSRERRWLALFLLVHLVDEHGRMSTAYRRILKRAAREPGHWAHGRSLGAVRAEVNRWIGVHARADAQPPWDRIADVVHAAVLPRSEPGVLATARYLHALATGEPGDDADRPHWLDLDVDTVTTSVIGGPEWARKHGLPVSAPEPRPPADGERSAYSMLWTVVRAHREAQRRIALLEHQVRELHEENARLSDDLTSWLSGYRPAIPDQERRTGSPRPVADRHLALENPAQAFTYPLPAELPASRPTG